MTTGPLSGEVSEDEWSFNLTLLAVLLGLVMCTLVVMKALGVEIP